MTLKEFEMQSALGSLPNTVKREMAENSNTPINILVRLSVGRNKYIRRRVAMNPNIHNMPEEDLIKLSNDKNYAVRLQVASNPNVPTKILSKILFTLKKPVKDANIKYAIECNPNASKEDVFELKLQNLKKVLRKKRKKRIMSKIYGRINKG